MTRPIVEPSTRRDITSLSYRTGQLERRPVFDAGSWVYVGTYPTDPLTTPDSPPFENSWVNLGGGYVPMRFRVDASVVQIEGVITGGTPGTVAFHLPTGFRPDDTVLLDGTVTDETFEQWRVDPDGAVTPEVPAGSGGSGVHGANVWLDGGNTNPIVDSTTTPIAWTLSGPISGWDTDTYLSGLTTLTVPVGLAGLYEMILYIKWSDATNVDGTFLSGTVSSDVTFNQLDFFSYFQNFGVLDLSSVRWYGSALWILEDGENVSASVFSVTPDSSNTELASANLSIVRIGDSPL